MLKRQHYITLVFIALSFAPHVTQAQSTCTPEQRKELILTAVQKDGAVIDNLRAEQLSLKVGSSPATIADVVFQKDSPLDLAVLIDTSVSQETALPMAKAAARAFIKAVFIEGQDRVAVVSFANTPSYHQLLTSNSAAAATAIDQIEIELPQGYVGGGVVVSTGKPPAGPLPGSTSLWDSVRAAAERVFGVKAEKRRRVVLLFTNGYDTSSEGKLNPAIQEANKHDLTVFSIGVGDPARYGLDEGSLKKLSEQTGGIARFPLDNKQKLEAALTDVANHLRGNYVIGYCGGELKDRARLQVEVVDPAMRKAKPVLAYRRY